MKALKFSAFSDSYKCKKGLSNNKFEKPYPVPGNM